MNPPRYTCHYHGKIVACGKMGDECCGRPRWSHSDKRCWRPTWPILCQFAVVVVAYKAKPQRYWTCNENILKHKSRLPNITAGVCVTNKSLPVKWRSAGSFSMFRSSFILLRKSVIRFESHSLPYKKEKTGTSQRWQKKKIQKVGLPADHH